MITIFTIHCSLTVCAEQCQVAQMISVAPALQEFDVKIWCTKGPVIIVAAYCLLVVLVVDVMSVYGILSNAVTYTRIS